MALLKDIDDAAKNALHEKELKEKAEQEAKAEAERQEQEAAEHEKNRRDKGTI